MASLITIGFVRASHGLDGVFNVQSASGYFEHFLSLKEVTLVKGGNCATFTVEMVDAKVNRIHMKLATLCDVEAIRKWSGAEVKVDKRFSHKLSLNEWLVSDLEDCFLIYNDEKVAKVLSVVDGGNGSLLEVKKTLDNTLCYVPLMFKYIKSVDIAKKEIILKVSWILD